MIPRLSNSTPSLFNNLNFFGADAPFKSHTPWNPPINILFAITRWHGTMGANGFRRNAFPTTLSSSCSGVGYLLGENYWELWRSDRMLWRDPWGLGCRGRRRLVGRVLRTLWRTFWRFWMFLAFWEGSRGTFIVMVLGPVEVSHLEWRSVWAQDFGVAFQFVIFCHFLSCF